MTTDEPDDEPSFGARFLDEYKRLGGKMLPFEYATLQELRRADREGLIRTLRTTQNPPMSHATIQRIRSVEAPQDLARDLLRVGSAKEAAIEAGGLLALLAMLV